MRERTGIMGGLVFAAALAGCTNAAEPSPGAAVEVIEGHGPDDAPLLVDLRDPSRAWLFDGTVSPNSLDHALLVCPNGAWMRLISWVDAQRASLDVDLGDLDLATFSLSADEELAELAITQATAAAPESPPRCVYCTDGAWICAVTTREPRSVTESSEGNSSAAGGGVDPNLSPYDLPMGSDDSPDSQPSPDETPSGQPDPGF